MRTAATIITIALLAFATGKYLPVLPWYTAYVFPLAAGLLQQRLRVKSFLAGMGGISLYWLVFLAVAHLATASPMVARMAEFFSSQAGIPLHPVVFIIAVSILGGLPGGLLAAGGALISSPANRYNYKRRKGKGFRKGTYRLKLR